MQLCHFADKELGDFAYVMLNSDPVCVTAVYDSVLKNDDTWYDAFAHYKDVHFSYDVYDLCGRLSQLSPCI